MNEKKIKAVYVTHILPFLFLNSSLAENCKLKFWQITK